MNNLFTELEELLKTDERFVSQDGRVLRNAVYEAANKMDEQLLTLLTTNENIKKAFFKEVNNMLVFDKQEFNFAMSNRDLLPDSYTRFIKKIGLTNTKEEFLISKNDVVLSFPFKDCVLEFDSTDTDEDRKEVYYNEVLAKNDIDYLLDNKVFTNFKFINKDGEKTVADINKDSNLLIKGNNLLVLSSLQKKYENSIQFMYWDILYNTKRDRVPYNDNIKHSSWLVMMKNRLKVAKKLLKKNGVIALQCDDNEMHYLKVLCDEIFKRENFLTCLMEQVRYSDKSLNEKSEFQPVFEYLLVYKASDEKPKINRPYIEYSLDKFKYVITELTNGEEFEVNGRKVTVFKKGEWKIEETTQGNIDNLKETWVTGQIYSGTGHGLMWQRVVEPRIKTDGYECLYKVEGLGDDGLGYRYYTGPQKSTARYGKMYSGVPNKVRDEIKNGNTAKKEQTIVNYINISPDLGNCRQEGGVELQAGKKPEIYLEYLLNIFTDKDDIVLDAYFGTGTTGAVALKMGRRFIGIEQLDSHYDKARTRLKNVVDGDKTGISDELNWEGGGEFICMELKKQNQIYVEKIKKCTSKEELIKLYDEIFNSGFISYRIDINEARKDETKAEFSDENEETMKKILLSLLDKNQLYVNYCDINDKEYEVSEDDIKINSQFYGE